MKHIEKMHNNIKCERKNIHFMRKPKMQWMLFTTLVLMYSSCNNDDVFEKEQYKNVFALISSSGNVSSKYHPLGGETVGYVAASLGGTSPTSKDIRVKLVEDASFIDEYNTINYDVDKTKYVLALPQENYSIDSYEFTIPAGEISGRLPVRIRPDGLSPDRKYAFALRVESYSSYEVNPEKNYIIYNVEIKNRWAEGGGITVYNMTGKMTEVGTTYELQMPGTKVVQPISKNQVRILAGNEKDSKFYLLLTIDDAGKVTISPYKNAEVTQINDDTFYSNTFFIEDDGFNTYKTFRLKYEYKSGDKTYEFREELRLQFNADEEAEEELAG
ncbi:DUF1735 domain-containing protein [Proteiniphilum sp.]|uniref:BT_3987 domain-containing protein n=1 Tax=Proteiniphilum sp. TaxID=1926877 RepID=UPI003331FAD2